MPSVTHKKHPVTKLPLSLYPHQQECVDFVSEKLKNDGWASIIHDAGLGKTTTILRTWAKMRKKDKALRLIVSCPACTLRAVWEEHAKIWLKNVNILVIDKLKVLNKNDPSNYDIVFITRNLVSSAFKKSWSWEDDSEDFLDARGRWRKRGSFVKWRKDLPLFDHYSGKTLLVIDESHYLRNGGRRKVCVQAHHYLARNMEYAIINTATPVCNRPEDVASQLFSIALEMNDDLPEKVRDLVKPKTWKSGKYTLNEESAALFSANSHRRLESILNLPELTSYKKDFVVSLSAKNTKKYNKKLEEARCIRQQQKKGDFNMASLMALIEALTKMSQMAFHPILFKTGAKDLKDKHIRKMLETPSNMMRELSNLVSTLVNKDHKKIVIFGLHTNSIMKVSRLWLEKNCRGTYDMYHGGLSQNQRDECIKNFLAPNADDEKVKVLFVQMIAGGVGLNLVPGPTSAIFIQQSWNPMDHLQAFKRIHRIGQTLPVQIYNLVGTGTPDDAIREIHEDKLNVAGAIVDGLDLGGNPWRTKGRAVDLCKVME